MLELIKCWLTLVILVSVIHGENDPLAGTMVRFVISARNLPDTDKLKGYPDAYIIINHRSTEVNVTSNTATIKSHHNPRWNEIFQVEYKGEAFDQKLTINAMDDSFAAQTNIGSVMIALKELVIAPKYKIEESLGGIYSKGRGKLLIDTMLCLTDLEETDIRLTNTTDIKLVDLN